MSGLLLLPFFWGFFFHSKGLWMKLGGIRHRARHECVKINVWDSGECQKRREKGKCGFAVSNKTGSFPPSRTGNGRDRLSCRLCPFEGVFPSGNEDGRAQNLPCALLMICLEQKEMLGIPCLPLPPQCCWRGTRLGMCQGAPMSLRKQKMNPKNTSTEAEFLFPPRIGHARCFLLL